jgi:hypothetical protein
MGQFRERRRIVHAGQHEIPRLDHSMARFDSTAVPDVTTSRCSH